MYITLKDVHELPKEAVICNFTEKTLDLRILGLDNINYSLIINNLCEEIDTIHSNVKIKPDTAVVSLPKKHPEHWSHIRREGKRIKKLKALVAPDTSDDSDVDAAIMSLIQSMYRTGDHETKKTIVRLLKASQ